MRNHEGPEAYTIDVATQSSQHHLSWPGEARLGIITAARMLGLRSAFLPGEEYLQGHYTIPLEEFRGHEFDFEEGLAPELAYIQAKNHAG